MVFREIITFPCFLRSPFLVWGGPEGVGRRKTESHEGEGCHVERAIVGVPVGYVWMRANETNGEESARVIVLGERRGVLGWVLYLTVEHTVGNGCEGGAHLSFGEFLRESFLPCKHSERLEGSHAVRDASANDWEGALWRDETLKDDTPFLHTLTNLIKTVLGATTLAILVEDEIATASPTLLYHLKTLAIHWLDDV